MPRGPESSQDIYVDNAFPPALEEPLISESNEFYERKKSRTNFSPNHHGGNDNPVLRQMREMYKTDESVGVELKPGEEQVIQSGGISSFILDRGKFNEYNARIDEKRSRAAEKGTYNPQSRFAGFVVDPDAAERYHSRVSSEAEKPNTVQFDPNKLMRMLEGADD